jgi:hypothetical protein
MAERSDLEQRMAVWRQAAPPEPGSSITDEELADLVCGDLDETARMELADRMLADPEAVERYRLLLDLHLEADRGGAAVSPARASGRRIPRWALSLAATVAVALSGAGLWQWTSQPVATVRAGSTGQAVFPAADVALEAPPDRFEWTPNAGVSEATVRLMDAEAALVWQSPIVATSSVAVPDEVIATLAEGGDFVWTVTVSGASRRSEMGPFWFSVSPGPPAAE